MHVVEEIMRDTILSTWLVWCLHLCAQVHPQDCPQTGGGNGLPSFQNYRGDRVENNRIPRHHQAIIPSYKFECNQMCGNITAWGVDVHPGGKMHQVGTGMPYTLDLQVWRPSLTVDDSTGAGCYSLVGNNRFTSISLNNQRAVVMPSPQDYIQFQPGDVFGFYVEEARGDNDGVVILTSYADTTTFTSETVWYASIVPSLATSWNGDCPYSVGSSGVLSAPTRAAPVISVDIATYLCPPPSSMATIQPTPPPNPTTDNEETPPTTSQITTSTSGEENQTSPGSTVDPITSTGMSTGTATTNGTGTEESKPEPTTAIMSANGTGTELSNSTTIISTIDDPISSSSSPLGLTIGLVFCTILMIVVITTVISVIVCWRVRKVTSASFHTQCNRAYGITNYEISSGNHSLEASQSTLLYNILYNYPVVDTGDIKQNISSINIVTQRNKAYGTTTASFTEAYEEPVQCLEANETNLALVAADTDGIEAGASEMIHGHIETRVMPTIVEEGNQACLENYVTSEENKVTS